MDDQTNDPLVPRKEFCALAGIGVKSLQRIELRGDGPPRVELMPGFIRYRRRDINEWIAARTKTGARPAGRTPVRAIEAARRRQA